MSANREASSARRGRGRWGHVKLGLEEQALRKESNEHSLQEPFILPPLRSPDFQL